LYLYFKQVQPSVNGERKNLQLIREEKGIIRSEVLIIKYKQNVTGVKTERIIRRYPEHGSCILSAETPRDRCRARR